MKIGIKGQSFSGKTEWIYFESVPGSREEQVRVTTPGEQIYISKDNFIAMTNRLFTVSTYEPKHERKE